MIPYGGFLMVDAIRKQRESEAERQRLVKRCAGIHHKTSALRRLAGSLAAALEWFVTRGRPGDRAKPAEFSVRRAHYG